MKHESESSENKWSILKPAKTVGIEYTVDIFIKISETTEEASEFRSIRG